MKKITIEPERRKKKSRDKLSPYNNFGNDEVKWEDGVGDDDGLKIISSREKY